jgi:hypothetical protein
MAVAAAAARKIFSRFMRRLQYYDPAFVGAIMEIAEERRERLRI